MWDSGYKDLFLRVNATFKITRHYYFVSLNYFLPFRKSDWPIVLFHLHLRGPFHTPESVAQIKVCLYYAFAS